MAIPAPGHLDTRTRECPGFSVNGAQAGAQGTPHAQPPTRGGARSLPAGHSAATATHVPSYFLLLSYYLFIFLLFLVLFERFCLLQP